MWARSTDLASDGGAPTTRPDGPHGIRCTVFARDLGAGDAGQQSADITLSQQRRQLEQDGIVTRIVHAQVPPTVEYHLTEWGESLCPALDELLGWAEKRPGARIRGVPG